MNFSETIEKNLNYELKCPTLLICEENDKAGSAKYYNRKWSQKTELPLIWIKEAGYNANTDQPELVNQIILKFVKQLK